MQLELFESRYPEIKGIKGWVHVGLYHSQMDGWFCADELKKIADFIEKVNKDFKDFYAEVRKINPNMDEEPVNAFWHDFCDGMSPARSCMRNRQYAKNCPTEGSDEKN